MLFFFTFSLLQLSSHSGCQSWKITPKKFFCEYHALIYKSSFGNSAIFYPVFVNQFIVQTNQMCFISRYSTNWFKTHWNCNLNGILKQSEEWCFWGFVSILCRCVYVHVCVCPCVLIWGHVYTCLLKATIHNYKSISKCSLQNSISSLLQSVTLEFCPFPFVYMCLPCYLLIFW